MIDLRDISCFYDGAIALSHVSLHVQRGESVAFIGPNGSGKSTLLKVVNGLVHPESGSYAFNGEEITRKALQAPEFSRRFHQSIGLLFQSSDTQLFCPVVYDEIAFGPRQMGLAEQAVDERVQDCLRLLAIEHLVGRAPWRLSEGEKRKVALASVLSLNPDVLTLDEPMNGLDPKTKRWLRELLASLHAAGKTILCSTHDFAYVDGLFQRAVVLSERHELIRDDHCETVLSDAAFLELHNLR